MVRVFAAYHYGGQTVHPVDDVDDADDDSGGGGGAECPVQVLASAIMDDDHLILAKSNHSIEIVSLVAAAPATPSSSSSSSSSSTQSTSSSGSEDRPAKHPNNGVDDEVNHNDGGVRGDWKAASLSNNNTTLSFPTLDKVHRMLYCKQGNYILTLETVATTGAVHCRVYTNWWSVDPITGCYNTAIRARVADKVTPSGDADHCLDVIELPTTAADDPPVQIACCPVSGHVCVASDRAGLRFFRFHACRTNDAVRQPYIDFRPAGASVRMPFGVRRLVMCENWIAAGSDDLVAVLRLVDRADTLAGGGSDDAISAATSLTEDAADWWGGGALGSNDLNGGRLRRRSSNMGYEDASGAIDLERYLQVADEEIWPKPMGGSNPMRRPSASDYRPVDVELECVLLRKEGAGGGSGHQREVREFYNENELDGNEEEEEGEAEEESGVCLKTMLRLKQRDQRDPFRSLSMRPIYMAPRGGASVVPSDLDSIASAVLQPRDGLSLLSAVGGSCLVGVCVLVATANDGYVYQLSSNDKWTTDDESTSATEDHLSSRYAIASYPFTAPAIDVQMNDAVLHALTDRGLETYTLRTGHRLFGSPYEYCRPTVLPHETSPRLEDPICLIGLRPFLGVRTMHLSDSSLVLLAADQHHQQNSAAAAWTIYHLRLPSPLQLTNDLVALAAQHRADSRPTFALLAAEAHMVARVALEYLRVQRYGNVVRLGCGTLGPELREAFLESCRLLGDCCLGSNAREDYGQAFGYYAMGELGVADVLRRALRPTAVAERRRAGSCSEAGLVHTIRCMLLKGFLRQESVLSTPIDRRGPFVEALLDLLLAESPDEVAPLMLRVPALRDAASAKWCAAIRSKQRRTAEDRLCLLWESVRVGQPQDDDRAFVDPTELYTVLIAHWTILFDSAVVMKTGRRLTSFSELTESHLLATQSPDVQRAVANVFVHLAVDAQLVGVDVLLRLLLDYLASRVAQPGGGSQTAQLVLTTLLEAHFYRRHLRDNGSLLGGGVGGPASKLSHHPLNSVVQLMGANSSSSSDELTSNSASSGMSNGRRVVVVGPANSARSEVLLYGGEAVHAEAIKILVRLYLGHLKRFEMQATRKAHQPVVSAAMFKFMRQNLDKLHAHHVALGAATEKPTGPSATTQQIPPQHGAAPLEQRPVLFADRRLPFLDAFVPAPCRQGSPNGPYRTWPLLADARRTVFKLQALLCSGQLGRDVLQEIVYFAEANAPIAGLDGLAALLLPDGECALHLLETRPDMLLAWARDRIDGPGNADTGDSDRRWSALLIQTLDRKAALVQRHGELFFKQMLSDMLQHLVQHKRLTQIIKIFPVKCPPAAESKEADQPQKPDSTTTTTTTTSGEDRLFTEFLTQAIDRDRAERLGEMIKTTGYQLYETYNRNKQFFN